MHLKSLTIQSRPASGLLIMAQHILYQTFSHLKTELISFLEELEQVSLPTT
jgi:hypothetical protein